jgi:hypothetical protein
MDEWVGPLIIKRTWSAAHGRHVCQIAWTTEQLLRIERAIEEGDEAFLTTVEEAMRQALDTALTSPRGKRVQVTNGGERDAYRASPGTRSPHLDKGSFGGRHGHHQNGKPG